MVNVNSIEELELFIEYKLDLFPSKILDLSAIICDFCGIYLFKILPENNVCVQFESEDIEIYQDFLYSNYVMYPSKRIPQV